MANSLSDKDSLASAPAVRALVSPQADFWMIGGLSLLFLVIVIILDPLMNPTWLNTRLPLWVYGAAFIVNYPHFAYSYQLFYRGLAARWRTQSCAVRVRLIVAGFIAPTLLVTYLAAIYYLRSNTGMEYAIAAMYFLVGWHYTKQGYGALITMSVYKRIFYRDWEKRILIANAYLVWIFSWAKSNSYVVQLMFSGVPYHTYAMPHWLLLTLEGPALISTGLTVFVFLHAWLIEKRGISLNGIVGYICSSYVWLILPTIHPVFFAFVPMFHSLQYMPFVYKLKMSQTRAAQQRRRSWRYASVAAFAMTGALLGAIFLDLLPRHIDDTLGQGLFMKNFFLAAAILTINIHHYFIDNAFWRRDNTEVQEFLFRS